MHIGRRISVRFQLTLAFLAVILASWLLSTALANYFVYLSMVSNRNEMLRHPEIYRNVMPPPHLGISDLFLGTPRPGGGPPPGPPPGGSFSPGDRGMMPPPDGAQPPQHPPSPPPNMPINMQALSFARLILALVIALLAGAWLGRFFTKPLNELSDGATALHSGNLAYRVPIVRDDEFSDVADAMNDMAERVSEQIEQLKDDAKRRRQFLADVAHELRSPVTTMKTMAGALQDGLADDPERKVVAVDALVRTSDRLLRLVVDLMDLAKLDLKELPMNLQEADVREVLIASVTAHQEQARAAGITLDPIESGEPVMAVIDPDRITQVLDNIIDNAIEYAGNGSEVNFHLEDGNPVRLTISDNGKGIPTDAMPYVFDSFYRVDAARTPRDAHAGLGLRIAQSIIEAHGGSLTLTSTEGQGSQVAISLPNEGTGGPAQSSG